MRPVLTAPLQPPPPTDEPTPATAGSAITISARAAAAPPWPGTRCRSRLPSSRRRDPCRPAGRSPSASRCRAAPSRRGSPTNTSIVSEPVAQRDAQRAGVEAAAARPAAPSTSRSSQLPRPGRRPQSSARRSSASASATPASRSAMAKASVSENSRKKRPMHAAHQQQRDERGDERQADRHHREADLPRRPRWRRASASCPPRCCGRCSRSSRWRRRRRSPPRWRAPSARDCRCE